MSYYYPHAFRHFLNRYFCALCRHHFVSSSEVPAITRDPPVLSVPLFLPGKIPYAFHSFQEYFCLLLSYRRQCPALRIHQRNHDPLHSLFPLLCEIYPLILAIVFLRPQNKQTFLRHIFQCRIHCLGRVEPIVADLPLGKRLFSRSWIQYRIQKAVSDRLQFLHRPGTGHPSL